MKIRQLLESASVGGTSSGAVASVSLPLGKVKKRSKDMEEGLRDPKDNPCWKGYKPVGTKQKGGRTVPNCVPKESVAEAKPGWMLKQDPKLAAKVKAKTDLAKKRQASYGDPSAGKSADKKGVAEGASDYVGDAIEALRSSKPGLEQEDFLDELYMYIENQYGQRAAEMMSNAGQDSFDEWYDSYTDMAESISEEQGYDEVSPKSASYILRKLDQGVPMSSILDDFPELSRMMDVIAHEHGLHPDDDFEQIEDVLMNDLEDIAAQEDDFGDYDQDEELPEVSLGDYRKKAGMQKAQAGMGAVFAPTADQRAASLATFKKRERGLERVKARDEKARKAEQEKRLADLVARLPELKAEYERMRAEYKSLGGSNWQYADREQNLTDYERKARSMEGPMQNLWRDIQAAEKAQKSQGVAEGLGKSIKRGMAGWGAFDKDKPADVVKRVKGQDTDTLKGLSRTGPTGRGSPAELQQKAISRELKKRGEQGVAEETIHVGHRNSKGDWIKTSTHSNYADAKKAMADLEKQGKKGVQHRYDNNGNIDPGTHNFRKVDEQGVAENSVEENKKGVRAPKHTVKPRNFVAKNAIQSGAGAHKDKKKAQKQGETKHKGKELAYESKLWAALERKVNR